MRGEFPTEILELIFMHLQDWKFLEWTLVSPSFNQIISTRFLKPLKLSWSDDSSKENFEASTRTFDGIMFKNIFGVSPITKHFMKENVHLHKILDSTPASSLLLNCMSFYLWSRKDWKISASRRQIAIRNLPSYNFASLTWALKKYRNFWVSCANHRKKIFLYKILFK